MHLWNAIMIGFKEIGAHKFRSLLTMAGIILGVSSLVAMSALVKGMENGLKEALIQIGGLQKIRIEEGDLPARQLHLADQAPGLTLQDVLALQQNASLIELITPEMRGRTAVLSRGRKNFYPYLLYGTWPSALEMSEHEIAHGRMFNDLDDQESRNVCVIGTAVRDALFGSPEETGREINPVGEPVLINGQVFNIIGMFKHYEGETDRKIQEAEKERKKSGASGPARGKISSSRNNPGSFVFRLKNSTVLIPLNTMWTRFRAAAGVNDIPDPRLSSITIRVVSMDRFEEALQQTRNVLMATHKGIEDFTFRTQEDWADQITTFIRNARLSGGIIAAISLLVGGIGIMNIMLASITERIREIGIRKAIGATDSSVFAQILVESSVIAVTGGLAGLLVSRWFVDLLIYISPTVNTPVMTWNAMTMALAFSILTGIVAGLFPAFKAARLNPIRALRYD